MADVGSEYLGQLVDEHAAALTLYARQWCSAPEDVVQDAFIKLITQRVPPLNAVAWLYRVVRNAAISAARSARARQRHEKVAAGRGLSWLCHPEGAGLDAGTAAQALQGLPIEQREAIVAHLWGGLTFEQIAELTGSSSSTTHRWYLAGLTALRERLKISCPNNPAPRR
jgi:DNA-directed RNA polymerase specialized sigma24 family protein